MRCSSLVPIAVLSAAGSALAQTHISDATFVDTDWSHAVLYSMGTVTLGPMMQAASGGNPGAFQQGGHTSSGAFAAIYDGHLYTPGVYDPGSQGAIQSADIRYDRIILNVASIQSGLLVQPAGHTYFRTVRPT